MKKKWLIKRKNKIQGPFDSDELKSLAEKGELSERDEVNQPLKCWVYAFSVKKPRLFSSFEDNTQSTVLSRLLAETQKKYRIQKNSSNSKNFTSETAPQETAGSPGSQDGSSSKTENLPHSVQYQELEKVSLKKVEDHSKKSLENADEIDYEADDKSADLQSEKSLAQFESLEHIENKYKMKARRFSKFFWQSILGICALAVFGFLYLQINPRQMSKEEADFAAKQQQELEQARQFFKSGSYHLALDLFKKASRRPALMASSDWLNLSVLLLQVEDDVRLSREALEKSQHPSEDYRGAVLKAVMELKEGRLASAQSLLKQADSIKPDSDLVLSYKFILKMLEKDFVSVQDILNQLQARKPSQFVQNRFISFLSLDSRYWLEGSSTDFSGGEAVLNNFINEDLSYSQETALLSLYNDFVKKINLKPSIQKLLDHDPYLTQEFHKDILFPSSQFIWQTLLINFCSSIYKQLQETAYHLALYAFCQTQSGGWIQARPLMEKAKELYSSDPMILAVYAYILHKSGLHKESSIYIEQSIKHNKDQKRVLPFILQARFCQEEGNFECAQKNWNEVQKNNRNSAAAQAGQALALYHLGEKQKALQLAAGGLKQHPKYLPFHKILSLQ